MAAAEVEYAILGPLQATAGGEPLPLGGRAQRALLAALLLRANEAVSVEFDEFAQAAIARLEELRLTAVKARLEADLALGHHDALVPELRILTGAAEDGGLLVIGLSERWESEGLGAARWDVTRSVDVPVLFARRGLRPGGISPPETLTRFPWSATLGPH